VKLAFAPLRVDIRALIAAYGIEGRYEGRSFVGHCPNPQHAKKPGRGSWSIVVEGEKAGLHVCRSSGCGFKGGPPELVAMLEGVELPEARRLIIEKKLDLRLEHVARADAKKDVDGAQSILRPPEGSFGLWMPKLDPRLFQAKKYAAGRGFTDARIERHRVLATLPDGPSYPGRLIVPVIVRGEAVDFVARLYLSTPDIVQHARRFFRDADDARELKALWRERREDSRAFERLIKSIPKVLGGTRPIARKELVLWNYDQLDRQQSTVHVVEGIWGALALMDAGLENVVAACGSKWTPERTALLAPWPRIVLVADGDEAGRAMAEHCASLRDAHEFLVADLGDGIQPDDLEPEQLRRAIARAKPKRTETPWLSVALKTPTKCTR
jgi:hypothetical protein